MIDVKYMQRALALAKLSEGFTSPNPMVGAVIVHDDIIIGEGYHHKSGLAHAEVEAINSVKNVSLLRNSTMYVSLEPCSHYGKTPPCVDLIIKMGIPRVVIAMQDPYCEVSGRGIAKLRECGVDVKVGVLEQEAMSLNRFFVVNHTKNRPYITLKWAESSDGFMDIHRSSNQETPITFTSPIYQRVVHRERMIHDAIMVGYRTALLDNPTLTNRYWYGKSPIRVVLDRDLTLNKDLNLFKPSKQTKTIVLYNEGIDNPNYTKERAAETIAIKYNEDIVNNICSALRDIGIFSVLIEGGSSTLQMFIDANLYDEMLIEVSPVTLSSGVASPVLR